MSPAQSYPSAYQLFGPNPFRMGARLWGQKPQPFHKTRLGKLPAEVREMIYQHALIASPSQPPIELRRPKCQMADTNLSEDDEADACIDVATTKDVEMTDASAASERPDGNKLPNVALLQTCHQISREAYHMFYANNSFRIVAGVKDLCDFLRSLEPDRRNVLRSLDNGRVLTPGPPCFVTKEYIDQTRAQGRVDVERVLNRYQQNPARPTVGVDTYEAMLLLQGCKQLRNIHLHLESYEEVFPNIVFLRTIYGYNVQIELTDGSHWVVRRLSDTENWFCALKEQLRETRAYETPFPSTHQLSIQVDIILQN